MASSLGEVVSTCWEASLARQAARERDQVTTLHDWTRMANGQYRDDGWLRSRPVVMWLGQERAR